ncbi:MAG: hypothetical protein HY360_15250 [Verrucomicrobia bacterium]|nr:hypothetical protein [Verrucomicrobiota bacterium]
MKPHPFVHSLTRLVVWIFAAWTCDAGEILIRIDVTAPPRAWPAPCTVGVPFPKGTLKIDAPVGLLDADGQSVPVQTRVHATWDADGREGARWILLDFQAKDSRPHRLVFGGELKKEPSALPPLVTEKDDGFIIDTGVLKTTCLKKQFDPWRNLTVGGQKQIDPSKPYGLLVEHEKRGVFLAIHDRSATVALEENGPWRATLKASGWYANEKGEKFGRYQVRLHFYRNQPDIKMEHTFIFTGESLKDRVRDLAVVIPLAAGEKPEAVSGAFGGEEYERISEVMDFSSRVHWSLVCDRPDGHLIEWTLKDLDKKAIYYRGEKNAGWVQARAGSAAVCLAVRDAWQQNPFEAEANGPVASFHLWPRHGRLLDLSFDGIWYYLSEEQKLDKLIGKAAAVGNATPAELIKWCRTVNRSGIAKTHEIWLMFRAEELYAIHDRVRNIAQPVLAVVDPAWACGTGALLREAHPYDVKNFRDEEAYLATILDLRLAEREQDCIYGFFEFGGYHEAPFCGRDGGLWYRARPKSHYGWSTYAPSMYYRTGLRRYLKYAQEYTGYSFDRGICYHDHSVTKDFRGGTYHYNNSEIGWFGGSEFGDTLTGKEDAIYLYWMTGERRMLDALLMWAEMTECYENNQLEVDPNGQYYRNLEKEEAYGNARRNLGGLLQRWTLLYQATWDPRWKARADRVAESFRDCDISRDSLEEQAGYLMYHAGWVFEGLWDYYQLTGDARIREVLLKFCRRHMERGLGFTKGGTQSGSLNPYAMGFLLTGDTAYLRVGRNVVMNSLYKWAAPEALDTGGKWTVQTLPRFLGVFMKAPRDFLDSNLPTHKKGLLVTIPQDHHICFLKTHDQPVSIEIASYYGGPYALYDPDGQVCAQIDLSYEKSLSGKLEVKPDGKTGVYTLVCRESGKRPGKTPQSGWPREALHYVIQHNLAKVVYELPRQPYSWQPLARSFVFQTRGDGAAAELTLSRPLGEWISGRSNRLVELGGKGTVIPINACWPKGAGTVDVPLPSQPAAALWRFEYGMQEGQILTIPKRMDGGSFFGSGLSPYFAATPDEFFEPKWKAGVVLPFQRQKPK